jgi:hypothetical protein
MNNEEITRLLNADVEEITQEDIKRVKTALKIAKIEKDAEQARITCGIFTGNPERTGFKKSKEADARYRCLYNLDKYIARIKERAALLANT